MTVAMAMAFVAALAMIKDSAAEAAGGARERFLRQLADIAMRGELRLRVALFRGALPGLLHMVLLATWWQTLMCQCIEQKKGYSYLIIIG
jgi:hypothetical protein